MRKNLFLLKSLTVFFAFIFTCSNVFALPSLDALNWDTLEVEERVGRNTNETMITVIRDSKRPEIWYYVPNRPRLAETITKVDGEKMARPVFQLMTLQTKDAETRGIYEEGMLQFSLKMDLQPETASQAKQLIFDKMQARVKNVEEKKKSGEEVGEKIEETYEQEKDITFDTLRLIPLPVSSASVSIYEPSGKWLSSGIQQPAIAPIFSTQAVPFQINLTSLGADAMKSLTQKGQGGLGVYYEMHFEGVLPPANLTVEVNWDQTFEHFSENTKEKHYWNALLFAGGTKTTNKQTITEDLVENKCIKITTEGREDDLEALQQVLDPILQRINNELVAKMSPPEKVDPAEAKEPSYGIGMFYGGGSSYAMKDKKVTKSGTETFTFNRSKIITRATSCGTFIGIGNYDQKIIDEANIVMEPGNWEKAYYTVPTVGNDPDLLSISLNQYVVYKGTGGKTKGGHPKFSGCPNPQLINWGPKALEGQPGWTYKNGDPVHNISWPLQALYKEAKDAGVDINDYVEYKNEFIINATAKQDSRRSLPYELKLTQNLPMMSGDKPVTNPMTLVDYLTADFYYITFGEPRKDTYGIRTVTCEIKRKDGTRYFRRFDYRDYENYDTTQRWFIPANAGHEYVPNIKFVPLERVDGKRELEWEYNGKPLRSEEGWGSLYIDPGDEAWDPNW